MKTLGVLSGLIALGGIALVAVACGGNSTHSGFDDTTAGGSNGASAGDDGGGGGNNNGGFGVGDGGSQGECQGIGCKKVICNNGMPTTIAGQVMDPAGKNPLYNVIVYIPTDPMAPLPALSNGVSCDKCGATALNPVASALTDESGHFVLKDVPVMKGVPIVVQVGKWRKKISFDVDTQCGENMVSAPITLPKNGTEGDMPQIAVTTGGFDSLECLLLGVGIDQSEFVMGAGGTGHVHMFSGSGGWDNSGKMPTAKDNLWNDKTKLAAYDITALSCEGDEHNEEKTNMQAIHDYAEAGGRIFATHYHYTWFKNGPQQDFKSVANWKAGTNSSLSPKYVVEQGFPKGKSFAQWLVNVGASTKLGEIPLNAGDVTDDLSNVNTMTSQAWIDIDANNVKYFSFNAPISAMPDQQCGASSTATSTSRAPPRRISRATATRLPATRSRRSRRRSSSSSSICRRASKAIRRRPRRRSDASPRDLRAARLTFRIQCGQERSNRFQRWGPSPAVVRHFSGFDGVNRRSFTRRSAPFRRVCETSAARVFFGKTSTRIGRARL
jgi:hypothetical protein